MSADEMHYAEDHLVHAALIMVGEPGCVAAPLKPSRSCTCLPWLRSGGLFRIQMNDLLSWLKPEMAPQIYSAKKLEV
jgi:hypothetical protein